METYRNSSIMNAAATLFRSAGLYEGRPYMYFRDQPVGYPEFEAFVRKAASMLRTEGVQQGDRVAILSSNKPEWLASYYAILSLGAVVVPINPALKSTE